MATKQPKWEIIDVPAAGSYTFGDTRNRAFTARVHQFTGAKASRLRPMVQIQVVVDLNLDGSNPQTAAEQILIAGAGLTEARIDVETVDDYGSVYTRMQLRGWSSELTAEQTARVETRVEQLAQARARVAVSVEEAEQAKLLELAAKYPQVVAGLQG